MSQTSYLPCALALLLAAAGCAEQPPDVNQVQPNLIDKQVLQGQWWYASTAIDVRYDEAFLFGSSSALGPWSGSMSTDYALDYNRGGPLSIGEPAYSFPIARIKFVIDEKFLFAYRAFELVAGGNDDAHDEQFLGQPLSVFAIDAHVDVRKDYDPITGEETNVTTENTTDRKWHERQYVRVDWSQNLLHQFAANDVQANELFTSWKREPVPFFFQEGAHDDFPASYQPSFVRVKDDAGYARKDEWPKDAQDTVHYMSFVTQEVWSPGGSCLTQGGACASATATMRNSFLRVPPRHQYAARTETHAEFDRFGIFRSHQPTYARGGRDRATLAQHCFSDDDCGSGGACDTKAQLCVGGLTSDQGETDFLSFFLSRHNFYDESLTDTECVADWQCDHRYEACDPGDRRYDDCLAGQGSVCDPAARRCTIPERKRATRRVVLHLSPHFPPYLVRSAFDVVAQWNEALMRGRRATLGRPAIDQALCDRGVCLTDLRDVARLPCQRDDPTAYCYCGSPEDQGGECRRDYDAFEPPKAARARGIPSPYDCHVEGPKDALHPASYQDYAGKRAYDYAFTGDECLLVLRPNSCDLHPGAPCEELGDLRYHFLSLLEHGGVVFAGVAQPLSDPMNGELVATSATIASESLEQMATLASQFFPVLRGELPEDSYFTGENVRGYFARLGSVERPVSTVAALADADAPGGERPAAADAFRELSARADRVLARAAKLKGAEGRAAIFSDRKDKLAGSGVAARVADAVRGEAPGGADPQAQARDERKRRQVLASRNIDVVTEALYNSQYLRYYADAFAGAPLDEAALRMRQAYFRSVALHEVGHLLGLRHNFAASLDRDQYQDGYFALNARTPLPSYFDYDADGDGEVVGREAQRYGSDLAQAREERLALGAGTVMSSSVMDYSGDLSDYSGLGRYDRAAVLFSYFGKVEAYDTGNPRKDPSAGPLTPGAATVERPDLHRRSLFSYYRGGERCARDEDCPSHEGRDPVAYQPIHQRCVGNPRLPAGRIARCDEPSACVCSSFHDDLDAYVAGTAYRARGDAQVFSPVRYLYCHDNRTGDLSWCTPFDAGESFQEVVEHYRRSWRERYPRLYFRNFDAAGPARGASATDSADVVKIYQHMFFRLQTEGAAYRNNFGPRGFLDQLFASAGALDWLTEIIALPDVGSYQLDPQANVYRQTSGKVGAPGAGLSLPLGQGYPLWSEYQSGLNGYFRLERAGTFLDKLQAIEAIAKRDWGLPYQADEFYYVNFLDFFEREVIDLFGGLIMRNPRAYAPRVTFAADGSPQLRYLSSYRGETRGNQSDAYPEPAVDGSDSEVLRDVATIEALSNFPVYYDTSFEQRLLVWKLGSGDGYEIPETRPDGTPTCRYGQPGCETPDYIHYESQRLHTTYVAVVIDPAGTGQIDEQQLAFQLLKGLSERQTRIAALAALAEPTSAERDELSRLRGELQRDESFLEYLIELERALGISSYFF